MYTIGQMSEMFQIPISTLRYYDKEGLFPGLERAGGIRQEYAVKEEMHELEKTLAMIRYKQWYYEQAMKDGTEERVRQIPPEEMPEEIRTFYELAFEDRMTREEQAKGA